MLLTQHLLSLGSHNRAVPSCSPSPAISSMVTNNLHCSPLVRDAAHDPKQAYELLMTFEHQLSMEHGIPKLD